MLATVSLLSLRVHGDAITNVSNKEQARLAGLRAAALHGDRSIIPDLIQALRVSHETYIGTALHGFTHLHSTEDFPEIDLFLQQQHADYTLASARAAQAHIITEAEMPPAPPTQAVLEPQAMPLKTNVQPSALATSPATPLQAQNAHARIQRFLQEMNLDMDKLKAGVAAYNLAKTRGDVGWNAEVWAANEIADMAYYGDYAAYAEQPEVKWLQTVEVMGASFKLNNAAVPKAQRAQKLVDHMAKTGAQGGALQLAIDEELPASRYAAKKVLEMDKHREQYAIERGGETYYHAGFASLFRLIAGVGDKEQLPVIEHFLKDRDGYIAYYAHQVHGAVKQGIRKQWAVGY